MEELVDRLECRGVGCHLIDLFIACLLYADDLCLLAPTRKALQIIIYLQQKNYAIPNEPDKQLWINIFFWELCFTIIVSENEIGKY